MILITAKEKEKHVLRETLKSARKEVPQIEREDYAASMLETISGMAQYIDSKSVGIYINTASEMSTHALIEHAHSLNKKVYCPYIEDAKNGLMSFKPWTTKLKKNRYGIEEPAPSNPSIDAKQLDIIFLPLVGFDTNGERLGMGGGFYDRLLEFKRDQRREQSITNKPLLIGLAYEVQKTTDIPTQGWDIKLDAAITERKSYIFNPVIHNSHLKQV